MLRRLVSAYGSLPHHPGKGLIIDQFLPLISDEFNRTKIRNCQGVKYYCDLRDKLTRELYYFGFNPRDRRVLRRFINTTSVVLDAGANIGYYSLLMAKWGAAEVHSFEPFPSTAEKFRANLSINLDLANRVILHTAALSDHSGSTNMTVTDDGNCGCNRIEGEGPISVTTIDEFCGNMKRLDFVKIDVEGTEIAVLNGARDTILRCRPNLMIEVNESTLRHYGRSSSDLISWLKDAGYKLSVATRFGGLAPLEHIPTLGEEPNVFAVHKG